MKSFPLFSRFSNFYRACIYSEGSTIEWPHMTFNWAQLAVRPVSISETKVPFSHKYNTIAPFQALCVRRGLSGCWTHTGEPRAVWAP